LIVAASLVPLAIIGGGERADRVVQIRSALNIGESAGPVESGPVIITLFRCIGLRTVACVAVLRD